MMVSDSPEIIADNLGSKSHLDTNHHSPNVALNDSRSRGFECGDVQKGGNSLGRMDGMQSHVFGMMSRFL
jgi:hypothetical protein